MSVNVTTAMSHNSSRRRVRGLLSRSLLAGFAAIGPAGVLGSPAAAASADIVDTFVVRRGPATVPTGAGGPSAILSGRQVGETFCNEAHCVVRTTVAAHRDALLTLEALGLVSLEPLPDAHRLFFVTRRTTRAPDRSTGTFLAAPR